MILTLILYCNAKKMRSGREIAAACHDDLGARVITGNRFPDRTVIDRFLRVHAVAVKQLFPQTLRLGQAEDLVDVTLVAGDGTKVVANAAMSATVNEVDLQTQMGQDRPPGELSPINKGEYFSGRPSSEPRGPVSEHVALQ